MSTVMTFLGVLFVLYYLVILAYTKRIDTTFTFFWPAFAVVHFGFAMVLPIYPLWLQTAMLMPVGIFWCLFVFVEVLICKAMTAVPERGLAYVIVLGAQVRGTRVTNSLERRLLKAKEYLIYSPGTFVIVSGGQGSGEEITEAQAMRDYLVKQGVSAERIRMEDRSRTTRENLEYSKAYLESSDLPIGIITNNFHLYRALLLGRRCGYKALTGIAASSNPVLFVNYMMREFFAVLQQWFLKNSVDK